MTNRMSWLVICLACACSGARATVHELPADGSSIVGTDTHIKATFQDTLLDIARRNSLGYEEIIRANPGVDVWLPGEGKDVLLPGRRILPPGPREGLVVNLPEHRLYYYPKPKKGHRRVVITYPVSIGRMDWNSPLGQTTIVGKQKHPNWYPPESIRKEHAKNGDPIPRVVPPGPKNPLGEYKMRLGVGDGTYEIHGTNNPLAVGMAVTHGCIRMYPEDVAALFPVVPVGTKVWLINDPVKVTYVAGDLLMEVHPPVDGEGQSIKPDLAVLSRQLDRALGNNTVAIHWDFARQELEAATGMPTLVGLEADVRGASADAALTTGSPTTAPPAGAITTGASASGPAAGATSGATAPN
jgi:L,D-transpeptidase ErfK/SrfK